MSEIKWTDSQRRAIKSRGDVQVAASAGTGKTAVLSHRCIDLLLDDQRPADIDKILVLTFTEDAAAEMKERIARTLAKEAKGANRARLKSQLLKIDIADISTIHSFCRKIIADNFYRLGIDPSFTIIEGDEQRLLRQEILADIVELAWESETLTNDLRAMFEGRDPDLKKGVLKNIYSIDEFLNSLVDPERWMAMCYEDNSEKLWDSLSQILMQEVDICRSLCRHAISLDESLTDGHYQQNFLDFENGLSGIEESIKANDRAEIESKIDELVSMRFKSRPRGSDETLYNSVRYPVAEIAKKKILTKIKNELAPADVFDLIENSTRQDTAAIIGITKMFREEYRKRKQQLKCLDFGDLERLALQLLTNEDGSPSDVAKELREHYQYVFVDEYQDVNKLQDRIVELVSRGGNLFIVGDVKQSIYSWRQARPELFLNRIKNSSQSGADNIYLNDNFRCRKGVVDFVNLTFSELMTSDVAGMDYDENAALGFGAKWYLPLEDVCRDQTPCCNELHIITSEDSGVDEEDDDSDMSLQSTNQKQAMVIAKRIQQLVGGNDGCGEMRIAGRDGLLRDVQYGDIVILLRSLKGRVNDYVDVLRQFNIPVEASVTGNYFESPEVNDCLAILKVLDNPMRDIELAAAMRSPVFGFSDSELYEIRKNADNDIKVFYNCVLDYTLRGGDDILVCKLKEMLEVLESWRELASRSYLAQVIWQILRHNDYLSFVSALPGGLQRRGDLLKLHERGIQFEGFVSTQGNPSLSRFVDFIERLRESEGDWSQAETDTGQSSSVRIMSIHKSKGLEFPVVFMPAMEKSFNLMDVSETCLLDEELPLGLKVYLGQRGDKYNTDSFNIIKRNKLASNIAEEMRTLYVAMTRAREKLIMVADTSKKDNGQAGYYLSQKLEELANLGERKVLNWWLSDSNNRSYLDWIVAANRDDVAVKGAVLKGGKLENLRLFVTKADELSFEDSASQNLSVSDAATDSAEVVSQLCKRFEARYRYEEVLSLPVKNSVSSITHRDDEFKVDYSAKSIDTVDMRFTGSESEKTDPRLIGTATHLVFEHLDLMKKPTEQDVAKLIERFVNTGAISAAIAQRIDAGQILAFFDTEPGRLLFDTDVTVHREYPFTIALTPQECGYQLSQQEIGDDIIVQGIIDLLMITPEGMVIVDFKTDNVTAHNIESRAEIYKKQLRLYACAVSKILKSSVAAQWLYFLKPSLARRCDE
ncbi:MAG: helicase-exonuclease AddAB subunit AddA [Sedimentisphaeraceae bacterium JB056]